jgi:uncharacterized protein (UPF0332 family)
MQNGETRQQKHVRNARRFLEAADELFDQGDYFQTSEKLWGAASHAVKVFCIRRRWRHSKYSHLREAVIRLAEETGDVSLDPAFRTAYSNHLNFYSDGMEADDVGKDRPIIRLLVDKLLTAAGQDDG